MAAHAKLVPKTEMGRAQIDRWLALFEETVDGLSVGGKAGAIKRCVADMANDRGNVRPLGVGERARVGTPVLRGWRLGWVWYFGVLSTAFGGA